mmetsp:Transcript_26996/g.89593  ORF Transcript_26996/g.89593 Transcript_26996/m.89593 type:complete len:213 (+) Transcript_26996:2258-2896(+)
MDAAVLTLLAQHHLLAVHAALLVDALPLPPGPLGALLLELLHLLGEAAPARYRCVRIDHLCEFQKSIDVSAAVVATAGMPTCLLTAGGGLQRRQGLRYHSRNSPIPRGFAKILPTAVRGAQELAVGPQAGGRLLRGRRGRGGRDRWERIRRLARPRRLLRLPPRGLVLRHPCIDLEAIAAKQVFFIRPNRVSVHDFLSSPSRWCDRCPLAPP